MRSMLKSLHRFIRIEDGLVTVEWVALTAGMVVAAVAIGYVVMLNTGQQAQNIGTDITSNKTAAFGADSAAFAVKMAPAPAS